MSSVQGIENLGFKNDEKHTSENSKSELEYLSNSEKITNENPIQIESSSTLHRAILNGKTKKIYKYLSKKSKSKKLNKQDVLGRSALHLVASKNNYELMRLLLSVKNINVELRDKEGKTPFFKAVQVYSFQCMKELYSCGASPNTRDFKGDSPLDYIIQNYIDDMDFVQFLVEDCEVSLNAKNDHGFAPLHLAAMGGHVDLIEYFIERKSLLNIKDLDGNTPLALAKKHCQEKSVRQLMYFGATDIEEIPEKGYEILETEKLKGRYDTLTKQCEELREKEIRVNQGNESLKESIAQKRIRSVTENKRNVIQKIQRTSRLFSRYKPKQTSKHLNEKERMEELKTLKLKYKEVEVHYNETLQRVDQLLATKSRYQDQIHVSNNNVNSSHEIKDELKRLRNEYESTGKQITELDVELSEFRERLSEVQMKMNSFEEKRKREEEDLKKELDMVTGILQGQRDKCNYLQELKEKLIQKNEEVKKGEDIQNQLAIKLKKCKEKYNKLI